MGVQHGAQEDTKKTPTNANRSGLTHAGNNRHGLTQADSDKRKRIQTDKHRQHTCRSRLEASCLVKLAHTADPSMLPHKQSAVNALTIKDKAEVMGHALMRQSAVSVDGWARCQRVGV